MSNKIKSKVTINSRGVIDSILARLTRLEDIEKSRGNLFLFWVETDTAVYLVASHSFESCKLLIPEQHSIDFVGMAYSRHKTETIIRATPAKIRE